MNWYVILFLIQKWTQNLKIRKKKKGINAKREKKNSGQAFVERQSLRS